MESKSKVKVCPICSNSEIAIVQSKFEQSPKPAPKFVPMVCIGEVCKFYNEETKECIFVLQTLLLSKIATKLLINEIAEAQKESK